MDHDFKILVVDDDDVLRQLIVSIAAQAGAVHSCESGNEAIAYLEDNEVDLVLSDVCMPNGTGIDVLNWLRGYKPDTPLVFVTGDSPISSTEAVRQGAHQVIKKPFRMKVLLDMIKTLRATAA